MVCRGPRQGIKELGREHGPDEQMGPQGGTGSHDGDRGHGNMERQQWAGIVLGAPRPIALQQMSSRHPPDWAGPVADEGQDAYKHHAVAAYAIVCARKVDGRDGIRAAKREERQILGDQGGNGHFNLRQVQGRENASLNAKNEKQRDICDSGLCHQEQSQSVVDDR